MNFFIPRGGDPSPLAPFALKQRSLEDDPLLLRGLAGQGLVRVPARAVVVAYVGNGLVWQCSRVECSPGISPSAAVDPIAVTAERVVGQWKHDRMLRIQPDYNACGTSF